jgi:hypothetical protein
VVQFELVQFEESFVFMACLHKLLKESLRVENANDRG